MHMQNNVSALKNMQFIIPQVLTMSEMKSKFAKNMPLLSNWLTLAAESHLPKRQGPA